MKSGLNIKKNGEKEQLSEMILPEIIREMGKKYSEEDGYELWRVNERRHQVWYVLKHKTTLARITPNKMNQHIIKYAIPKITKMKEKIENMEKNEDIRCYAE